MTTQKYPFAILACILGLVVSLGFGTYCAHAADPVITTALDEIGLKYSLDQEGDVWLAYSIEGSDISFYIQKTSDSNDLRFTWPTKDNGIRALLCLVRPECRGNSLKQALSAFALSIFKFQAVQSTYAKESGLPETKSTSTANASSSLTDFNIIPVQYRESDSKVKAWLKQQGYFGKNVSIKARVGMVNDRTLLFKFDYANASDSLFGSSLSFTVQPNNYSPLDYNENDVYIISGQISEDMMWPFKISNPTLQLSK
jgi:hypothetical protein